MSKTILEWVQSITSRPSLLTSSLYLSRRALSSGLVSYPVHFHLLREHPNYWQLTRHFDSDFEGFFYLSLRFVQKFPTSIFLCPRIMLVLKPEILLLWLVSHPVPGINSILEIKDKVKKEYSELLGRVIGYETLVCESPALLRPLTPSPGQCILFWILEHLTRWHSWLCLESSIHWGWQTHVDPLSVFQCETHWNIL